MERIVEEFKKVSADPIAYGRALKEDGRKIIAFFCTYTPEEIIHASGVHPMRLFGTTRDSSAADRHLQAYCCSLVRGALAQALSGELDFIDGAVFPHTCDSIQRLSDIWRLNTAYGFFADVVLPVKLTSASARSYFEDVLAKLRSDLEKGLSTRISDDDLRASIRTYNSIRASLSELYGFVSRGASPLLPGDVSALVRGSMILERSAAERLLKELVRAHDGIGRKDTNLKRVMLVGGLCDHPDIYRLLLDSGALVVWDDLCTGSRYFEGAIPEDGDPIANLAGRYFERAVCPAKHSSTTARARRLVEAAIRERVQGVIFLQLKFCDPHAFDYPYLKETLDSHSIPSMLLEIEDQLPPEGQLLTRFETFVQTI